MDKLKIGVVLDEDYAPTAGGGYSYYDKLINLIDRYEFNEQIEIAFLDFSGNIKIKYNKQLIPIRSNILNSKTKYKFLNYTTTKTAIRNTHQGKKIRDILSGIYTNDIENILKKNAIDLLYYCKPSENKLNYPYIATHWDIGHKSMFAFPEVAMNNTFNHREESFKELHKAFAIFAESEASVKELEQYEGINSDRIFVLPLFPGDVTNLSITDSRQKEILNLWNIKKSEYFFYPAQFWSHKNHYAIIKSLPAVLKKHPNTKVIFTGSDKGNLAYIQELTKRHNLQHALIFAGFVETEEIYTFYKNAISLVMPTFLGPTNMPLLEANQLGCPVLCSDIKGHIQLMGDKAIYFNPRNFDELAEKMNELIKNSTVNVHEKIALPNIMSILNKHFVSLLPLRKTFGFNFNQY
jgi:glycosyltransferase involved in cell wall biosynthesis